MQIISFVLKSGAENVSFLKKKMFDALCGFYHDSLKIVETNHIWEKFPLEINCSLHLHLPFNETVKGSIVAYKFQGIYTCKKVAKSVFHDHLYFPGIYTHSGYHFHFFF